MTEEQVLWAGMMIGWCFGIGAAGALTQFVEGRVLPAIVVFVVGVLAGAVSLAIILAKAG